MIVVSVRALEGTEANGRRGSYIRADRVWQPGWQDAVVDDKTLEIISSDPWLEVRRLDPLTQAKKKQDLATLAEVEAIKAETAARELRARADELAADAMAALDAAANEPTPAPARAATPFRDALIAATPAASLPDEVRAQIELDRAAPFGRSAAQVAAQLTGVEVHETQAPITPPTPAEAKPKRR